MRTRKSLTAAFGGLDATRGAYGVDALPRRGGSCWTAMPSTTGLAVSVHAAGYVALATIRHGSTMTMERLVERREKRVPGFPTHLREFGISSRGATLR